MKKIILVSAVLLLITTGAFADQTPSSGGTLAIGGGAKNNGDDSDTLSMGLSNSVQAVYEDGDVIQTQWYAIATAHPGGKQTYGTAQDVSSLYKLVNERTPGDDPDFSGMPADNTASETWSGDVWEAL